jgi:hypothetical protein
MGPVARRLALIVLAAVLAGCAVKPPTPLPAVTSIVPTDSFDRTDLVCYYGPVW